MASLLDLTFAGAVIEWRGPAPFYFVAIPAHDVPAVRDAARAASYGWGCVPVSATVDDLSFTTSLFPRDGGYLLPLKAKVRQATGLVLGDLATVHMRID